MEYSGARGTPIHEKKLKSKISCQTPFKALCQGVCYGTLQNNFAEFFYFGNSLGRLFSGMALKLLQLRNFK